MKWLLSEKLGRDVGFRIACIDFLENMEQARNEYMTYKRRDILIEMGAQTIGKEASGTPSLIPNLRSSWFSERSSFR